MTPSARVRLVAGAALVLAALGLGYGPLTGLIAGARTQCLAGLADPTAGAWCGVVVRYPHRLPVAALALVCLLAVGLGLLLARWCLRPVAALVGVVEQMGPANLGYRLGWRRRGDVVGRLGEALDAMMDRISSGYDSQRRFAANASHELRTPLAVQRTLIEVGLEGPLTPDQLSLLTTQLLATNERNERLVEGLLVLAEAEQAPLVRTPQRLDRIAESVVDAYGPRAEAAGVALSVSTRPTTVAGEQVLLERLIGNLVRNAIAYNLPVDGWVRVQVDEGTLAITNSGPTVAAEDVDLLFEPFRRGRGERRAGEGGAGLGLTICRAVATAHHASIAAAPGPAGGLTVQVELPAER
jgi:signal transduction histidine kinase